MLLCETQEMPVKYRGRDVTISDKVANAHYYMCNLPVNDAEVGMHVGIYLNGQEDSIDEKLKEISDEDLTRIVEAGIKEEFLSILDEKTWESIKG